MKGEINQYFEKEIIDTTKSNSREMLRRWKDELKKFTSLLENAKELFVQNQARFNMMYIYDTRRLFVTL